MPITSIAVYCASSSGRRPEFAEATRDLGSLLARRGIRLVYGGGHVGLMGMLADAALDAGGDVLGVITKALQDEEVAHGGLRSLVVVDTMHARKAAMADAADAFVMLPGGYGTFDEFFEALTWTQLGIQHKPCGVLDVAGFFQPLVRQVRIAVECGFVRDEHAEMLTVDADPEKLIDRMEQWRPVAIDKWIDRTDR